MDNRMILIGLHELAGIGWKTILKLMNRFMEPKDILTLTAESLAGLHLQSKQVEEITSTLTPSFVEQKLMQYEKLGIRILTLLDPEYPAILKETAQPPWVLYYKGHLELCNQPLLGMVGTRTPTAYGKKIAEDMALSLSRLGFGVVSGLARGIDSAAHQGALQGKAKTIAVLGCAIDRIYPPENGALYRQIEQQGLILSEYPIGMQTHPGMFPLRNRIIAGLSLGVVVVEAAQDSGSLITAAAALEESRDVFAVPGAITSPKSVGVLSLIKEGAAKMITSVEDIIEEYPHLVKKKEAAALQQSHSAHELTQDELEIIKILSIEPFSIDDLLEQSQYTFGHLHSVLLSLLLKKAIIQLPGSIYMKT
ncbi:DNA-processing protein DprA [Paenibacillus sp. GP183]|uniref:DNA-processing protein DprA n=1 Tax=Paenibacillus sp. GP183 TaxID=1882751 RepID=UPI00089C7293|nr:DNA-processing protein DprA [Paenibacillus sp. GP183]SEB46531.1 DNA processing protein [Paenibacillus sp. GP183]